jgi:hypothetical protein
VYGMRVWCPVQIRLWQALAVVSAFVPAGGREARAALDSLLPVLASSELTTVKQYPESIATALLLRQV